MAPFLGGHRRAVGSSETHLRWGIQANRNCRLSNPEKL